jgi:hypothetical protein
MNSIFSTLKLCVTLSLAVAVTGCADLSQTQKHWMEAGATVLAVGAIAAYKADHDHGAGNGETVAAAQLGRPLPCHPQPDGTCR